VTSCCTTRRRPKCSGWVLRIFGPMASWILRGLFHLFERKPQGFDNGGPARDFLIDPSSHRVRTSIAWRLKSRCDELLLELLVREGHPCRFVKPFDDRLRRSRGSDQCDVVLNDPTGNAGLDRSGDFWCTNETPGTCDSISSRRENMLPPRSIISTFYSASA
jgi:hypothetical protein